MNAYDSQAQLFRTLMHPGRLAILDVLRGGEACVCHLQAILGYRQAYISQQLMVLRDARMVADRRDGWNVYYRVMKPQVFSIMDAARDALGKKAKVRDLVHKKPCTCPNCSGELENAPTAPER